MIGSMLEIDYREIDHLAEQFKRAEREAPAAIARAIRRTGDMTATRVVRTLTAQTGLQRQVIARAEKKKPAGLTYSLKSRGGNVALKYFKARETRKGVSAAPWNHRRVFSGTFIKGGRLPKRVGLNLGGQGVQAHRREPRADRAHQVGPVRSDRNGFGRDRCGVPQ